MCEVGCFINWVDDLSVVICTVIMLCIFFSADGILWPFAFE